MIYVLLFILLLIIAILIVINIAIIGNKYNINGGNKIINGSMKIIKGGREINNSNFTSYLADPTCFNNNVLIIKSDITRIDDCELNMLEDSINKLVFDHRKDGIPPLIIGNNAFNGCMFLSEIIQDNVASEEASSEHKDYLWPSFIIEIGINAFRSTGLISVNLSNLLELKIISQGVFRDCSTLTQIILPVSITEIEAYAFENCIRLISVNLSNLLELIIINEAAFYGCNSLIGRKLPASIIEIGAYAFERCIHLDYMDLSDLLELQIISEGVFRVCTSLTEIILPASIIEIGAYAFDRCFALIGVNFSDLLELQIIHNEAFNGCNSLTEIILPESITEIGNNTFYGCTALTEINFSNLLKLKKIGMFSFNGCTALTQIILPESITEIGNNAFLDCYSVNILVLPRQFMSTEELIRIGIDTDAEALRIIEYKSEEYYDLPIIKEQIYKPRKEINTFLGIAEIESRQNGRNTFFRQLAANPKKTRTRRHIESFLGGD